MKKGKGIVIFVIFLAIICSLGYYSYGIVRGTAHKNSETGVKLGLDLAGGVSITYQVKGDIPSSEDMSDTIFKLQQRVDTYSTEAEVYKVGSNRITVEIPGVTNASEILEELGTPGTLKFQTADGTTFMTGSAVKDAQAATVQSDTGGKEYVVDLTLTDAGAKTFSTVTGENIGKQLPIYYDGSLISSPKVEVQITDGKAQISGMSSYDEANQLATQIRSGALKLQLKEIESQLVGAKLGSEAITTSIKAAAVGIVIVMLFMIVIYLVPGIAASLALMIYTGLILGILHLYDITLTLPGIAGIILSIGMAVDANIIIFARIKEEIGAGRTTAQAEKIGFQKALSAIIDGHVTTLIASAILGIFGSGTVKGFAVTLAIGILLSLFTALFITRWILKAFYAMGLQNPKLYGSKKDPKTVDFVKRRVLSFVIPVIIIVVGFVYMGVQKSEGNGAFNFSLEFVGGTSTTVAFDKNYTVSEIDKEIVPVVEKITGDADVQTQKVQDSKSVIIKTRTLSLSERETFNKEMKSDFGVAEKNITYNNISSTVSKEMRTNAILAVTIATIFMLVYIWFRFKDIRFASAAVIALIHDVFIIVAFYALSRTSVGTTFIACILTILGYSINSTIIIFDRVREHLKESSDIRNLDYRELTNRSITQTLARTLNTNITVLITLGALYVFGVSSVREFAMPLFVGVIGGVYSSVLITAPMWYTFKKWGLKKNPSNGKPPKGGKKSVKLNKPEKGKDKIVV